MSRMCAMCSAANILCVQVCSQKLYYDVIQFEVKKMLIKSQNVITKYHNPLSK